MLLPVLQPPFDPTFSASSFGFRPGQSAHDAVRAAQHHIRGGWAVTGGPWNAGTSSDGKAGFGDTFGATLWQCWDTYRGRRRLLGRLGLSGRRSKVAHRSKGAWRIAARPSLQGAFSNAVLRRYGFWMSSDLA